MPSVLSAVQATTSTSPGRHSSMATCTIQLSPGWERMVTALPAACARGKMGRMYGLSSPVRPWASCTVATPSSPSRSMAAASARSMLRTATGFIGFSCRSEIGTGRV